MAISNRSSIRTSSRLRQNLSLGDRIDHAHGGAELPKLFAEVFNVPPSADRVGGVRWAANDCLKKSNRGKSYTFSRPAMLADKFYPLVEALRPIPYSLLVLAGRAET